MFNFILDKLPNEVDGYLIRSDFKISIMIMQCLTDPNLEDEEKAFTALSLFYGNGIPEDLDKAAKNMIWFLRCGKEPQDSNDTEEILDYNHDDTVIWSAFKRTYNIDLTTEKMHWWTFCALLRDIGDCALSKITEIRSKKYDQNTTSEERAYYNNLKRKFGIPKKMSEEEKEAEDEFMRLLEEGETDGTI